MSYRASQLRKAAERIAGDRYPDQSGSAHPDAFAGRRSFTEIRMTGGSVLVTREEAIARLDREAQETS